MTLPWSLSGWVDYEGVDVFVCQGKSPGPRVVVTACIHGDEYEGPVAVLNLVKTLCGSDVCGTILLIPVSNRAAVHAGTRVSPDGYNLARCFPGDPEGSGKQRLAAALFTVAREASFAIDLHSGGVEYDFAPLAGFYGDPADSNLSFAAAKRFGLPYLWQLPPTKGVLSNELSNLGIPVIGCEYGGSGRLSPDGVAAYMTGVLSCLRHWGCLRGEVAAPGGKVVAGDWQRASYSGFFLAEKPIGFEVQAGEPIARIIDERGEELQCFVAPQDGTLLALRAKAYIRDGDWGVLSVRHV